MNQKTGESSALMVPHRHKFVHGGIGVQHKILCLDSPRRCFETFIGGQMAHHPTGEFKISNLKFQIVI